MASSDSEIDKPQRGRPKGAEIARKALILLTTKYAWVFIY